MTSVLPCGSTLFSLSLYRTWYNFINTSLFPNEDLSCHFHLLLNGYTEVDGDSVDAPLSVEETKPDPAQSSVRPCSLTHGG